MGCFKKIPNRGTPRVLGSERNREFKHLLSPRLPAPPIQSVSLTLQTPCSRGSVFTSKPRLLHIGELTEDTSDDADELPEIDRSAPAVTRLGDCWRIGNHLLLCGDALKADSYNQLLGDSKAQVVFTDPPYNVAIAGNVSECRGVYSISCDDIQAAYRF